MEYRPNWQRIFFVAVLLNAIFLYAISLFWSNKNFESPKDEEQNFELIEVKISESISETDSPAENSDAVKFPDLNFSPIEIPSPPEPLKVEQPTVETPTKNENPPAEKKSDEDNKNKLTALKKVYPKYIVNILISTGAIPVRPTLPSEKIILYVTVGADGKVKNVKIQSDDKIDNVIKTISEAAASSWIFEPLEDSEEFKTQLEFKPEDF